MKDLLIIVAVGATGAAAAGALGLLLLSRVRRISARTALLGSAAIGVLAVLAGVVAAARAMFLSGHDFQVVLLVALPAGAVAVVMAALVGRQLVDGSVELQAAARALGTDRPMAVSRPPATAELAALHRELEATAARLDASRERERALDSSRRDLVAWVSHDLRTPLAGLRAMAEALEDGVAEDPARYHAQIRVEVDRLAGLVDDLFELSRIHSGSLRLALDSVPLADLISDTLSGADALARARGVELRGTATTTRALHADGRELSRALMNLVTNAIRHTPEDGAVVVSAADDGTEGVVIAVQDRCGGIPDGDLGRVFETGWRGSRARTPGPDEGAGLGLAIVRGIVEAHDGTLRVVNVDGGCRFELRLGQRVAARSEQPA